MSRIEAPAGVGRRVAERAADAPAADEPSEHQIWFGAVERPIFGWLSVPGDRRAALGVVLCAPLAEEGRSAHRTFRTLSRVLADSGALVLRFDYDGTGDSSGRLSDPDRLAAWLGSIVEACRTVRSCGVERVALVGMRVGATLAASAAAGAGLDLESLVLWDPCESGRSFLRESHSLHALGSRGGRPRTDGGVDTPGFLFPAGTVQELGELDLRQLSGSRCLARRVLVLQRPNRPRPARLDPRLREGSPGVSWADALDQDSMLDATTVTRSVPWRSIADIAEWLVRDDPAVPSATVRVPAAAKAVIPGDGGSPAVQERGVRLGPIGLFGVVTETIPSTPTDAAPGAASVGRTTGPDRPGPTGPASTPWIVFLNVAAQLHIGPGRKWVEFARLWAGMGFRCVRIDQSAVGDSPSRDGQVDDQIFAREWLDDVPSVVRELGRDGSKVILVGLCSGVYTSLETALRADVDAIVGFNPALTITQVSKGMPMWDPTRRAARPPAAWLARLGKRRPLLAGGLWRIYREFALWHAPMSVLAEVSRAGTDLCMICCPKDAQPFREVIGWSIMRLLSIRGSGAYRMTVDAELDHSLLTTGSQERAEQLATQYLLERYGLHQPEQCPETE